MNKNILLLLSALSVTGAQLPPLVVGSTWIYKCYSQASSSGYQSGSTTIHDFRRTVTLLDTSTSGDSINIVFSISDSGLKTFSQGAEGSVGSFIRTPIDTIFHYTAMGLLPGGHFKLSTFLPLTGYDSIPAQPCSTIFEFNESLYVYKFIHDTLLGCCPDTRHYEYWFLDSIGAYYYNAHAYGGGGGSYSSTSDLKITLFSYNGRLTAIPIEEDNHLPSKNPELTLAVANPLTAFYQLIVRSTVEAEASFSLFDIKGNLVVGYFTRKLRTGDNAIQTPHTPLPNGVYFLKVGTESYTRTVKLVISR